jgi:nitrate reductase NapE component
MLLTIGLSSELLRFMIHPEAAQVKILHENSAFYRPSSKEEEIAMRLLPCSLWGIVKVVIIGGILWQVWLYMLASYMEEMGFGNVVLGSDGQPVPPLRSKHHPQTSFQFGNY